jgi:hypothetical protein
MESAGRPFFPFDARGVTQTEREDLLRVSLEVLHDRLGSLVFRTQAADRTQILLNLMAVAVEIVHLDVSPGGSKIAGGKIAPAPPTDSDFLRHGGTRTAAFGIHGVTARVMPTTSSLLPISPH